VAVTVFPSVYKDYARAIEKDRIVLLKGRTSRRERVRDDEDGESAANVELLAEEISPLGNGVAAENGTGRHKAIHIRVDPAKRPFLSLIRDTLEQNQGRAAVYLHVRTNGLVQKVASSFSVEPNDRLRRSLEELVGRQSVWLE
jgi:hypothetical protein